MDKEFLEIVGNGNPTGSVLKETIAGFRHGINKRAKMAQPNPSPSALLRGRMREMHRETKVPEPEVPEESPSGRMCRWPCKDYLKGTCINSFCEKWHPPECLFYKSESGCRFGEKCSYVHRQVEEEQPSKRSLKNGDKSAVAVLKRHEQHQRTGRPVLDADSSSTRQMGCVFKDMEPPKSSSILRKSSNILKPIRCVRFTKAVVRHADIRDRNPSLGLICPGDPHQRNPNAPKFEDRSQEETEWKEQGAREAAWKLAKSVLNFKGARKFNIPLTFGNRCLPAPTNLKPEEREFVVDSRASMHMISIKDLNSGEMDDTLKSCSLTIFITANGEVQTHEEATVYVKEMDNFLTMKVLEKTPAVLSLGKLCDEKGYSYEWINGQKPHLIKNGIRIPCNTENFVLIVIPGLSNSPSRSHSSTSRTLSRQGSHFPARLRHLQSEPRVTFLQKMCQLRLMSDRCDLILIKAIKIEKQKKEPKREQGDPLFGDSGRASSEIPEWLQEFRENLVDDEIPEHGDSHASSSHEPSLEPILKRRADLGKHSVCNHFPKHRK